MFALAGRYAGGCFQQNKQRNVAHEHADDGHEDNDHDDDGHDDDDDDAQLLQFLRRKYLSCTVQYRIAIAIEYSAEIRLQCRSVWCPTSCPTVRYATSCPSAWCPTYCR